MFFSGPDIVGLAVMLLGAGSWALDLARSKAERSRLLL